MQRKATTFSDLKITTFPRKEWWIFEEMDMFNLI